jgi:hypothetical protein
LTDANAAPRMDGVGRQSHGELASTDRIPSPGGWTPPSGVKPGWAWLPPNGASPRLEAMPTWVRLWYWAAFAGWRHAHTIGQDPRVTLVRNIRSATEDEVVAEFLRAEIDSDRWATRILELLRSDGRARPIVDHPDLEDPEANHYRRGLLGRFRGWGRGRACSGSGFQKGFVGTSSR